MKKKVLIGLVLLIVIGTSAVFAQTQEKFTLEIWNITQDTWNTLANPNRVNDRTLTAMDDYFLWRSASGSTLRLKERDLTREQIKQRLLDIDPRTTSYMNYVNNYITSMLRFQSSGAYTNTNPQYRIMWIATRNE